jgi:hypothetical protein
MAAPREVRYFSLAFGQVSHAGVVQLLNSLLVRPLKHVLMDSKCTEAHLYYLACGSVWKNYNTRAGIFKMLEPEERRG